MTVKGDLLGDLYIYVVCETSNREILPRTGKSVGYDFGLKKFLTASDGQCSKTGSKAIEIPRLYPSSKTCSSCEYIYEELTIGDRKWVGPNCGSLHDRDLNAAVNIHRVGASTLGVETVRPA